MSVVIAVCTNNYKLMMADSRISLTDSNGLKPSIACEGKYRKYRVMNSNVCIGAAGDLEGVRFINEELLKVKEYTVDDYAEMIVEVNEELHSCDRNTKFILVGLDNNNQNSIITLDSKNNFKLEKITSVGGERAYRVAMPFMSDDLKEKFINDIELVVINSVPGADLEKNLKKILVSMSKVDITIDDNIRVWSSK